jgi:hypothetical protein
MPDVSLQTVWDSSAAHPPIEGALEMKSYKDSKVPLHNKTAFNLAKDFLRSVL